MSVVKINVLTVPPDRRETLERRFATRAGAVESSDGFEWFELLRPVGASERYLVYTRWRDEESFQGWLAGQSHGAPPGPDGPAATVAELWSYEVVQSAGPAKPA